MVAFPGIEVVVAVVLTAVVVVGTVVAVVAVVVVPCGTVDVIKGEVNVFGGVVIMVVTGTSVACGAVGAPVGIKVVIDVWNNVAGGDVVVLAAPLQPVASSTAIISMTSDPDGILPLRMAIPNPPAVEFD